MDTKICERWSILGGAAAPAALADGRAMRRADGPFWYFQIRRRTGTPLSPVSFWIAGVWYFGIFSRESRWFLRGETCCWNSGEWRPKVKSVAAVSLTDFPENNSPVPKRWICCAHYGENPKETRCASQHPIR